MIKTIKLTTFEGVYKVSILLPEAFRERTNIRVIYMDDNGVEIFDTLRTDDWITFETSHFSNFYLIGDTILGDPEHGYTNLWWIINSLALIILVLLGLSLRKNTTNNSKHIVWFGNY